LRKIVLLYESGSIFIERRTFIKYFFNADVDTFNIECANESELASQIAAYFDVEVNQVKVLFQELLGNQELRREIYRKSLIRFLSANVRPNLGRYLAIYSIIRITKPQDIIELGTKHGLGSLCYEAAAKLNADSKVFSVDINSKSGWLNRKSFTHADSRNFLSRLEISNRSRFIISDGVTSPNKIDQEFGLAKERSYGRLFFLHNNFGCTVQKASTKLGKRPLRIVIKSTHPVEKELIFWFGEFSEF